MLVNAPRHDTERKIFYVLIRLERIRFPFWTAGPQLTQVKGGTRRVTGATHPRIVFFGLASCANRDIGSPSLYFSMHQRMYLKEFQIEPT